MELLESLPVGDVALMIMGSSPIVALRALAEMMLNGDDEKLTTLMATPEVAVVWLSYGDDFAVNPHDHEYARQLLHHVHPLIPLLQASRS